MHPELERGFQDHMQAEFFSAYLYLAMAGFCAARGFAGMAHWLRLQWQEELKHGLRFFDFLLERGVMPQLKALEQPPATWESPLHLFEAALRHEQEITRRIHELYRQAEQLGDYPAQVFLQWFVKEQVEEESQARMVVDQLRLVGDSGVGLYLIDQRLGQRKAEED
jgi:ferritin